MPSKLKHQASAEKRLKILEGQLYGKTADQYIVSVNKVAFPSTPTHLPAGRQDQNTDIQYLKHDLTKIALLTTLAIGIQFLIYFSSRSNLLRLF